MNRELSLSFPRGYVTLRIPQRGVSMLFALLALVVLSFAAVALVRSVDTGVMVQGNLGFKQDGLAASATGAERAMAWLATKTGGLALENDGGGEAGSGYYATTKGDLDVTGSRSSSSSVVGVKWDTTCEATSCIDPHTETDPVNGNKVQWVITRLCQSPGGVTGNNCVIPSSASIYDAAERGEVTPEGRFTITGGTPYFRIVVRTTGPRNTVSYSEALVHF